MSKQENEARRAKRDGMVGLVGVALFMAAILCGEWVEITTPIVAIAKLEAQNAHRQIAAAPPETHSFWVSPEDHQVIPGSVYFEAIVTDPSVVKVHFAARQEGQGYVVVCADAQPDLERAFVCDWDPTTHPRGFSTGQIDLLYMEERDGQFRYGSPLSVFWDWARGLVEVHKHEPSHGLAMVANWR